LHFSVGVASDGQTRIWLDEQVRFESSTETAVAIYHIPFMFAINHEALSIDRLRHALTSLVQKHPVLATAVRLDEKSGELHQYLPSEPNDSEATCVLIVDKIANHDELVTILAEEQTNRTLFNLARGQLFRCRVILFDNIDNDDILILINIHHIAFDGFSMDMFVHDFQRAYTTGHLDSYDSSFQYIDYSIHEKLMDMSTALSYWRNILTGYDIEAHNAIDNKPITGHGHSIEFDLADSTARRLFAVADKYNVTLFQLGLSAYFAFLLKLSGDDQYDLLIGTIVANRYRHELMSIIGMFANTLPLRLKLNPQDSFIQLLQHVRHLVINAFEHGYLPYQKIIEQLDQASLSKSSSLVQNVFQMEPIRHLSEKENQLGTPRLLWMAGDRCSENSSSVAKFDLTLALEYDTSKCQVRGSFEYARERFSQSTIEIMIQRFSQFLDQLFFSTSVLTEQPLYAMNLLLKEEFRMLQQLNDTYRDVGTSLCIHQLFVQQACEHPQKLAMTMEQQSLTYAETLHYSQQLAKYLIGSKIICQLLERSIETVIGMLAIWMSGGVYTPLNPRDPLTRIQTCIQTIYAQTVLVHHTTRHILPIQSGIVTIDTDKIICLAINTDDHTFPDIPIMSEDISHIVFTSGSTGIPKAVSLYVSMQCTTHFTQREV
jgi:fengycin family lipopeptide synthetase D